MSDAILLEGKEYLSAKRAAEVTGYARDYIGQLARKGLIGAQRVGGLWYVDPASLKAYQDNAESYVPEAPLRQHNEPDSIVSFDGKDYVSAARGAKLTAYNQDYIGQLARGGKILSRQIGNRWYVEKEGLLTHKAQKDSMLASVQRDAVGLPERRVEAPVKPYTPYFSYVPEVEKELMPKLAANTVIQSAPTISRVSDLRPQITLHNQTQMKQSARLRRDAPKRVRTSGKTMIRAAEGVLALTFVVVLSYGIVTLKGASTYTFNTRQINTSISQAANALMASDSVDRVTAYLENFLAKDLVYQRTP